MSDDVAPVAGRRPRGGPRRGAGGFRRFPSRGWATTDTGELRALLAQRVLDWSAHAVVRAAERNLDHAMVSASLSGGLEVIEDYPRDLRGAGSLVLTTLPDGRPLHVVLAHSENRLRVVTAYRPDERPWEWSEDFRFRR